jgi:hypothetical protein
MNFPSASHENSEVPMYNGFWGHTVEQDAR